MNAVVKIARVLCPKSKKLPNLNVICEALVSLNVQNSVRQYGMTFTAKYCSKICSITTVTVSAMSISKHYDPQLRNVWGFFRAFQHCETICNQKVPWLIEITLQMMAVSQMGCTFGERAYSHYFQFVTEKRKTLKSRENLCVTSRDFLLLILFIISMSLQHTYYIKLLVTLKGPAVLLCHTPTPSTGCTAILQ